MSSSNKPSSTWAGRAVIVPPPVGVGLLLRVKSRIILNRLQQAITDAPVRFLATAGALVAVWFGLYLLFKVVFKVLQQLQLESAIAIPMVFDFFFVAMLVMLAISNAIIAYTTLFTADEAAYLLAAPVTPRGYVLLKYLETLLFSSWSLILLGLPLMMAMADINEEPWFYFPFFIAFFIAFVPIPGALGLVLAWALARFFSRRALRRLIGGAAVLVTFAVVVFVQGMAVDETHPYRWLNDFLFRLSFVQSAFLPSAWVSKGVEAALQYRLSDAFWYLAVTVSNACFLSLLAVRLVAGRFSVAFDRAWSRRGSGDRSAVAPQRGLAGACFFYLSPRLRLIAAKDMRTFFRDPLQWTQLVILFGLMALYLVNLPRFSNGISPLEGWGMIIPFLNFGAISFILATFTSRFVFPLVSLEGQQRWLIGMLPLTARQILSAKFAFAMTVSVGVAVSTTLLAAVMLQMPAAWAALQTIATFAVCYGLCGLAVGIGARLPMYGQRNAARIANGFGGTINLVASVTHVLIMLAGMAVLGLHIRQEGFRGQVDLASILLAAAVSAWGLLVGSVALTIGARHLKRAEH